MLFVRLFSARNAPYLASWRKIIAKHLACYIMEHLPFTLASSRLNKRINSTMNNLSMLNIFVGIITW